MGHRGRKRKAGGRNQLPAPGPGAPGGAVVTMAHHRGHDAAAEVGQRLVIPWCGHHRAECALVAYAALDRDGSTDDG
jgi:hypothetical protein